MASLVESDVGRIVGLVLSPHYCAASVGEYHGQAASMIEEVEAVEYRRIDNWHMLGALIAFQADQVRHHMRALPERTMAVFTAHSLPERVLTGDPYPDQLRESASAIAALAGLESTADWCLGWQSAGATPEAWRGPDLLEASPSWATRVATTVSWWFRRVSPRPTSRCSTTSTSRPPRPPKKPASHSVGHRW
ncbi:MAG: ferrochelatase [Microthrixaceae bacterium]|nr:ferrochelatase [Microthrixaceae bacterium]